MNKTQHIVDELIEERCVHLRRHRFLWPTLQRLLYRALDYPRACDMAERIANCTGFDAFAEVSRILHLQLEAQGLHHIPQTGRLVVIADHPTGLADGVAVFDALKTRRPDLMFLANADALRVVPNGADLIIPVEWVLEKRSRATARATLQGVKQAMHDERCIVMFPAGKLAGLTLKGLVDKPWASTAASLARKYDAPIAPLHIQSRNSVLYYLFCMLNAELRDITLFHELLNKAGTRFALTFGPLMKPAQLPANARQASDYIRHIITQELAITE
jgi:putative hemolysin